jgi:dTDP-4-dehydrorhamnose 3,5-epimerase
VSTVRDSSLIRGVKLVELASFSDERGRFLESFRKEWFPEYGWNVMQANRSDSRAHVLRGLHFHRRQVDYWYPAFGRLQVALYDLRVGSPTRGAREVFEIGDEEPMGVLVPPGVAHGFLALSEATLTYLVDRYYDPGDEHGVAWNDPTIAIPWKTASPLLSDRDKKNPLLHDFAAEALPTY